MSADQTEVEDVSHPSDDRSTAYKSVETIPNGPGFFRGVLASPCRRLPILVEHGTPFYSTNTYYRPNVLFAQKYVNS